MINSAVWSLFAGAKLAMDPGWRDLVLFYEYYNPDTGRGHGARYDVIQYASGLHFCLRHYGSNFNHFDIIDPKGC